MIDNFMNTDEFGFIDDIEGESGDMTENIDTNEISVSDLVQYSVVSGISVTNNGTSIKRKISLVNRTKMSNKKNSYIVIHYVGADSTAANNASYFYSVNRSASANYFVDENEIWQVVEDTDAAWHCGGSRQSNRGGSFYKKCLNSNSIGIEMCMKYNSLGKAYFKDGTVENTIDLTKTLMEKYNIPVDRVIRHYDVVGKYCPGPYVDDENAWNEFKQRLTKPYVQEHWAKDYYDRLYSLGIISNPEIWTDYDGYLTKAECVALLDKFTGGTWSSEESNSSIHWVQPNVISMCGKGYITDKNQWLVNPDEYISKALLLTLLDNITGGMLDKYKNTNVDHWARKNLNSLCDKSIIDTPEAWCDDFEAPATRGSFMALLIKANDSGKIV